VSAAHLHQIAEEVAVAQFNFSAAGSYAGATKGKVPTLHRIPVFLALFEHVYNIPMDGLLDWARREIDQRITNMLSWSGWPVVVEQVKTARSFYVEPEYLLYSLAGSRVYARMDLGVETADDRFIVYDWKCHGESEEFARFNQSSVKQQLLTYALWPVLRKEAPLPLDHVSACVFNAVTTDHEWLTFTERDLADFELTLGHWVRMQAKLFNELGEVDFNDLRGPYDPSRSCPWCQFKGVCGKEIAWQELN
jgi:hypothetical protein